MLFRHRTTVLAVLFALSGFSAAAHADSSANSLKSLITDGTVDGQVRA